MILGLRRSNKVNNYINIYDNRALRAGGDTRKILRQVLKKYSYESEMLNYVNITSMKKFVNSLHVTHRNVVSTKGLKPS